MDELKVLIEELKVKIFEIINLEDFTPDDLEENDQLAGGKLSIDSIDILELVMMIEQDYSVKIENKEVGKKAFQSLKSLSKFIIDNKP